MTRPPEPNLGADPSGDLGGRDPAASTTPLPGSADECGFGQTPAARPMPQLPPAEVPPLESPRPQDPAWATTQLPPTQSAPPQDPAWATTQLQSQAAETAVPARGSVPATETAAPAWGPAAPVSPGVDPREWATRQQPHRQQPTQPVPHRQQPTQQPPPQQPPPGWGSPPPHPPLGAPARVPGAGGTPLSASRGPVLAAGILLLLLAAVAIYPLADAIRIMAERYDFYASPAALMLGPIPVTLVLACAAAAAVIGGVGLLRGRPTAAWPAWSGCALILLYFWLQAEGGIESWWNSAEHGVVVAVTAAAALTVPVGILLVTAPARRFTRRARRGLTTAAVALLSVQLVYQLACLVALGGIQALDRSTSGLFTVNTGWYAATTAVLGASAVLLLTALPALLAGYAWARFPVWVSSALTVGLVTAAAVGSASWDWSAWDSWTLSLTMLGLLPLAVAILAVAPLLGTAGTGNVAGGTLSGGGWPAAAVGSTVGSTVGSGGAVGASAGVGAALAAVVATAVVCAGVGVGAGVGLAASNSGNSVATDSVWGSQTTPPDSSHPYYDSYPSYAPPTYSPPSYAPPTYSSPSYTPPTYPEPSPYPSASPAPTTNPTHPSGGPPGSESAYDALDAFFSDFQQAVRYDDSSALRAAYDRLTSKGRHYLDFDRWASGYVQTTDISDWTYDSAEATGTGLRIYLRWTSRQSAGAACLRYTGTMDVVPDGDSYLTDGWNVSASYCS